MMKKTKILAMALAFLSLGMLSSCLGDGEDGYKIDTKYPSIFNAFFDAQGNVTLVPDVAYNVSWNPTKLTADVEILGMQLPDGTKYGTLKFNGVKWGLNNRGWMSINANDLTPSEGSAYTGKLVFDYFSFQSLSRSYGGVEFPPCYYGSFQLNNQYTVFTLPSQIIEIGETKVTDSTGKVFNQSPSKRTYYYFILDAANSTGYLIAQGLQWFESMEGIIMKVPGLNFEVTPTGDINLWGNDIQPTTLKVSDKVDATGTVYPNVTITNFVATCRPDSGVDMTFTANFAATETTEAQRYDLTFNCRYYNGSTAQ